MKVCLYPGSFDPFSVGHQDVLGHAASLFDKVYVSTLVNSSKKPVFSLEERVALMGRFVQSLNKLYQDGEISYSNENLLNAATGEKLTLSQIVDDYSPYEGFLPETESLLMLCSGAIQAMAFGFETPLKDMPHGEGATYAGLDKNQVYMVILLTRMKNGQPAFVYLAVKLTAVIIDPISQEEYSTYMESEYVPSIVFGG